MNKYPHVPVGSVLVRRGPGRNDPCPCGSGKKFKKCCGKPKKGQGNA